MKERQVTDFAGQVWLMQLALPISKKTPLTNARLRAEYLRTPDKDGYVKVYRPYGEDGRGIYYRRPALEPNL